MVLIVGGALTGVPNAFSKAPASAVVATGTGLEPALKSSVIDISVPYPIAGE